MSNSTEQKFRDALSALAAVQGDTASAAIPDGMHGLRIARAQFAVEKATVDFIASSEESAQIRKFAINELTAGREAFAKIERGNTRPPAPPVDFTGPTTVHALQDFARARTAAATFDDTRKAERAAIEQRLYDSLWTAVLANRAIARHRAAQHLPAPGTIGLPRGENFSSGAPFLLPTSAEACKQAIVSVEAARTPPNDGLAKAQSAVTEREDEIGRALVRRKDAERKEQERERTRLAFERQANEARARAFKEELAADDARAAKLAAEREAGRAAIEEFEGRGA